MTEKMKPGNIAQNIGSIIDAQKENLKETTTAEDVKRKISSPKTLPDSKMKMTAKEEAPENKMIFAGFQYSDKNVAKIETFLPVANARVRLSPIVFEEELNLAQTMIEEKEIMADLLAILYKHIVEGPERFASSFESFLKHLHEQDYEPLLYGFYLNSYGPEVKLDETVKCYSCGGNHTIESINLLELYSETKFSGEEFESLSYMAKLDLDDCNIPATFYFKFPTMDTKVADKDKNISKATYLKDITNKTLGEYITKLEYGDMTYEDKESIKNAIGSLNVQARKKVTKFIDENFGKYGVKFSLKWVCKNEIPDPNAIKEDAKKICNQENTRRYRIFDLFFREISESIS